MSKKYVIDSSVYIKIFLEEKDSKLAKEFIINAFEKEAKIIVPSIFHYEIINIAQRNNLDGYKVGMYLSEQSNIKVHNLDSAIIKKSIGIINKTGDKKTGFPSFYDASYHAVAIINGCDFITADQKHYNKTQKLGNIKLFSELDF